MHDSKKSAVRMCPFKMNPLSEGIFFYNVIECIESLQLNTQIHSEMNLKGFFFLRDFDWRDLFWQPKKGPGQLLLHVVFLQSVNCISIYYKRAFYCLMSWNQKVCQKTVLKTNFHIFSTFQPCPKSAFVIRQKCPHVLHRDARW